jgi:hypothetical protein
MFRRQVWVVEADDVDEIQSLAEHLTTFASELPLSRFPELESAFESLVSDVDDLLMEVRARCKLVSEWGLTEEVQALISDADDCLDRTRNFVQVSTPSMRVEAALADFLRTEFWRHRWRIYEVWVLTNTIRCLTRQGGEVELFDVSDGVWHIRYGRAAQPCAVSHFDTGDVYLYYQFYGSDKHGPSTMPDIMLSEGLADESQTLAVIDPKHGRSYRKGRVLGTLRRYSRRYNAILTAIVNYYPVSSYEFNHVADGTRHSILASDVRTSSRSSQQFEQVMAEILTSRGYWRHA